MILLRTYWMQDIVIRLFSPKYRSYGRYLLHVRTDSMCCTIPITEATFLNWTALDDCEKVECKNLPVRCDVVKLNGNPPPPRANIIYIFIVVIQKKRAAIIFCSVLFFTMIRYAIFHIINPPFEMTAGKFGHAILVCIIPIPINATILHPMFSFSVKSGPFHQISPAFLQTKY